MKTTPATVENTFQRGMGIIFCDGKDVPNSDSNFINNTDNLGFEGSPLHNDSAPLYRDNTSMYRDNTYLLLDSASMHLDNASLLFDSTSLHLDSTSLLFDSAPLHHFWAFFITFFSKCRPLFTQIAFKNTFSFHNINGAHFNLNFDNYHILKILFLILRILFNKKHQYWCEPSYFT